MADDTATIGVRNGARVSATANDSATDQGEILDHAARAEGPKKTTGIPPLAQGKIPDRVPGTIEISHELDNTEVITDTAKLLFFLHTGTVSATSMSFISR